jgi:Aspartyl/Asparaginyl beta-hydroxylase
MAPLTTISAFAPAVQTSPQSMRLFSAMPPRLSSKPPETYPLPPHTFAGMVEKGMVERFGESNVGRVLESWRLLDRDYVHNEYVGDKQKDPATSKCHQLCHSYVPGLTAKEFWNTDDFDWCGKLASKYKAIRDEFKSVTADMDTLVAQGNNIWAGALSEDASSYGEDWKTLVLMNRGIWDPINANLFPVTAKAVHESGVPAVEVFFASMKPNTNIKLHSDFTNFVLTSHLPIDIPYSGENKCRLSIGDTVRQWINGDVMLFDTSIMHDAINESDKMRYILMLRVWHPDLTEAERQALQFTYNSLEFPGLVSSNPEEQFKAGRIVEAARAFPEIKKGTGRKPGFGSGDDSKGGAKKTKKGRR